MKIIFEGKEDQLDKNGVKIDTFAKLTIYEKGQGEMLTVTDLDERIAGLQRRISILQLEIDQYNLVKMEMAK